MGGRATPNLAVAGTASQLQAWPAPWHYPHKVFKMAYSMKTVAPSTRLLSPRPVAIRARASRATFGRSRLVIEAKTVWQLEAGGANKNKETVTLNDKINESKSLVSVGDNKHSGAEKVRAHAAF